MYYFNVSTTDEEYNDRLDFVLQLRTDKEYGHKWWTEYQADNVQVCISVWKDFTFSKMFNIELFRPENTIMSDTGNNYENDKQNIYYGRVFMWEGIQIYDP